ncbi:MAG: hypothetical protein IKL79_00985 [Clostridia bacterium]|nr:hypothetical protein [Clostridia bacterium]
MIKIKIAGLTVGIDNKYGYIEKLAADYLTEGEPNFTVTATEEQIREEAGVLDVKFSDGYLESIVVYRNIAEILPSYDAFVFHGAVLNYGGEAYAFTAKSGVGKTTHTRLWLKEFGDGVHYLNGDKPIIRFIDGVPYACGTPWRGKEGYGVNEIAPLRAIAFLERGATNSAAPIPSESIVTRLLTQMYMPRTNRLGAILTMRLADRITKAVRLVGLKCNMDPSAAHVSLAAMSGKTENGEEND